LSPEEKSKTLQYLMFLRQKRCGTIKGRGFADGRTQQTYMTNSPTVAGEFVMYVC
jgi:hypothetical protein